MYLGIYVRDLFPMKGLFANVTTLNKKIAEDIHH